LNLSQAATHVVSAQAESGTTAGDARVVTRDGASGGSVSNSVHFGPIAPPMPNPPPPAANPVPNGPTGNWNLRFRDEFDGSSVDTAKWTDKSSSQGHQMQGNPNNGQLEWNQMANCSVSNGLLTLRAKRETVTKSGVTFDWTSCLLTTGDMYTFQYGYIEVRSKQPACNSGMWPAFWTWQAPGANTQREVDVYEYWPSWAGRCAKYTSGTHGGGIGGSNQAVFDYPSGTTAQQFNTYGADIRSNGITFYLNGQQTRSISNSPDGPMSIIINMAVWADIPPPSSSNGAIKEVDYIRAWQR
jgi:beta-glucanase (GH16 family)